MNRIKSMFEELQRKKEKALVGFVTAGDPTIPESLEIIECMCKAGLDLLELGVPFSDPTADGPVIQRSSQRALGSGVNLKNVMGMTREIRQFTSIPIVLFSYYNPVLAYGSARFYEDALSAGGDGVLVVDLPPEESDEMTDLWPGKDLDLIRLVAPTTPRERMGLISRKASGFLYLVSMTGVTGSGGVDSMEVSECVNSLRSCSGGIPICVGFGISKPEQVRSIGALADGVVVGSAFERIIEGNLGKPGTAGKVAEAVGAMKSATRF